MNPLKILFLKPIILLFSLNVFCQGPGTIDFSFNPDDYGFGRGDGSASGPIDLCIKLPDGKYLIAGEFLTYNNRGPKPDRPAGFFW